MTRQLNFCLEITRPHWQLHDKLNFGLPIALLAWSRTASDVDSGPPPDVAVLLAQALVQAHRVSFLVADEALPITMAAAGSSSVQSIPSRGVVSALAARWHGEPTHWHWLSTCDAKVARTLFDQAGFDWTLQAQVVLLSPADAPAPVLDLELTQALCRGGSPELVPVLRAAGIRIVVRPGVDGAAVGLVGLADDQAEGWLQELEGLCRSKGWTVAREADG
ncbi:hypothetical protein BurJ1DRAFT_0621 [Burkholderiales bacterium JOSHI_001]|nr:hypothetical protein BurJ1DRAFT_0621 [Burkholderiales bacterium JOSHI_001]